MILPTFKIEEELRADGKQRILGMDEAGRGPLAGPLVCAGVIINNSRAFDTNIIRDSKTLSETQRERAFRLIIDNAERISFSMIDNKYIDANGMIKSLEKGYKEVVDTIGTHDHIILDGNKDYLSEDNVTVIVRGDQQSQTIAAASIVAKYLRDKYMRQSSNIFPEYLFEIHKGYGTVKHFEKIKKYGLSPLHRISFIKL